MKPCIVWQTDFGTSWGAVASMRGVCKQVDATLECYDITHEIEAYDSLAASRELAYVEPFWPQGTIFVSVVDPGVGTRRKACVALLKDGNYVVTPDNGTLTHVFYEPGIEKVREIDETVNRYKGTEDISVFHGRDIFAYTAARLASGIIDFTQVGQEYPENEIVLYPKKLICAEVNGTEISGIISSTSDPFGSIVFNIRVSDFKKAGYAYGDMVEIELKHGSQIYFSEHVLYHKSFGFVALHELILFNSSTNYVSLGLNQASFVEKYKCEAGEDWTVTIRHAKNN